MAGDDRGMTVARLVGLVVLIFLLVTVISEPLNSAATARSGGSALGSAGTSIGEFVSSLTSGAGTSTADDDLASSYIVRPGDTLSEIAAAHATTTDALSDGNDIDDPDLIAPGQELSLR